MFKEETWVVDDSLGHTGRHKRAYKVNVIMDSLVLTDKELEELIITIKEKKPKFFKKVLQIIQAREEVQDLRVKIFE